MSSCLPPSPSASSLCYEARWLRTLLETRQQKGHLPEVSGLGYFVLANKNMIQTKPKFFTRSMFPAPASTPARTLRVEHLWLPGLFKMKAAEREGSCWHIATCLLGLGEGQWPSLIILFWPDPVLSAGRPSALDTRMGPSWSLLVDATWFNSTYLRLVSVESIGISNSILLWTENSKISDLYILSLIYDKDCSILLSKNFTCSYKN